ncbi:4-(cytidine 5'-diphospho)-2-C-methyl-D-erythritol kinase [Daejeonella lutea]|uniref:4-diphosphocytidyl-2-C-methyl-D-erythritol kinase n=1 Tax=Daejeonella lutea TaxID=572036 RepID=A0A1T5AVT8_9SPHI|nr:4-(cytidine 5'-diphospho)-2-C-methyl-D-erythritol kinase [Daejeonella lutea]SKB39085.1 4-diphosphocytidyl-2-C-methyl-D-erythritol kinase [Daejeonella lutea]
MIAFPNAKINIGLNIVRKRSDGYHDLETVFYPVMIKDVLEVVEDRELSFNSSGIAVPGRPEDNICLKAYKLLSHDIKLPPVKIHLHKNIPIGAGLGGGSADASFFIKLMNEKFTLGLSIEKMENYASQLGADCPFFIRNQPVYAIEKGDKFENVRLDLSGYQLVLVMPDIHIPTSAAFRDISPSPSTKSLKDLIKNNISEWKDSISNDFEPGIMKHFPEILSIKESLYDAGAVYASMSGSGSSVYGIFNAPVKLEELEEGNRVFYGV